MYIINIGNEKPQSWLSHIIVTTHLLAKAKMCCFIYSLFDKIMYIIANKATFIVRENPNAYIKNNIKSTKKLKKYVKLTKKVEKRLKICYIYITKGVYV